MPHEPARRPFPSAAITSAPAGRPTTTRAIRLGLRRDLTQPRLVGHCHSPPLHGRCCLADADVDALAAPIVADFDEALDDDLNMSRALSAVFRFTTVLNQAAPTGA